MKTKNRLRLVIGRKWKTLFLRILLFSSIALTVGFFTSGLAGFIWRRFEPLQITTSASKVAGHFQSLPESSLAPEKCFLFLHGMGTTPQQAWRNVFHAAKTDPFWSKQVLLAPKLEKIAGFYTFDFKLLAQGIVAILNTIPQCSEWVIVGNSLGAWLGYYFAVEKKLLSKAVVGMNSVGLDKKYSFLMETMQNPSTDGMQRLHEATYYNPPQVPRFIWALAAQVLKLASSKIRDDKSPFLLEAYLPQLDKPALLIWGLSDRLIPNHQKDFAALFPSMKLASIEQCGHVPQEECWSQVSEIIQDWLGSLN